jgi:hypothetical protein
MNKIQETRGGGERAGCSVVGCGTVTRRKAGSSIPDDFVPFSFDQVVVAIWTLGQITARNLPEW